MVLSSLKFLYWAPKTHLFCIGHSMILVAIESGYGLPIIVGHCDYMVLPCTVSDIQQLIGWKLQIFPILLSRGPLFGCSIWKFAVKFTTKKLVSWGYSAILQWIKEHDQSLSYFDTIPACDRHRQTDGWTDEFIIAINNRSYTTN